MDDKGQPTNEELAGIKDWPKDDMMGLVNYVIDLWYYPHYTRVEDKKWYLSTGCWSGNEKILEVLMHTMFWLMCWEQSMVGGHYIFDLEKAITFTNSKP